MTEIIDGDGPINPDSGEIGGAPVGRQAKFDGDVAGFVPLYRVYEAQFRDGLVQFRVQDSVQALEYSFLVQE